VLRSTEAGLDGELDSVQLAFAAAEGRVICTRNTKDFRVLHRSYVAEGRAHAGLVIVSSTLSLGEQIRGLVLLAGTLSAEELGNSEQFCSDWAKRVS
jgi:hypothetical protein